jgi:hypothetical protein
MASQPDLHAVQRRAVAPGDLQQRSGPDGALQVHVQLDLRERHGTDYRQVPV